MENLREQIFQVTNDLLTAIQQLTEKHTALVLQETFSSLGSRAQRSSAAATAGAKRGADELEQLSKRFAQFVHDNPGLRIEQINKQLGTTTTELALPIRKLVSSGDITVKGQKRSTTYFADKNSAAPAIASDGKGTTPKKSRKKRGLSKKNPRSRSKSKK